MAGRSNLQLLLFLLLLAHCLLLAHGLRTRSFQPQATLSYVNGTPNLEGKTEEVDLSDLSSIGQQLHLDSQCESARWATKRILVQDIGNSQPPPFQATYPPPPPPPPTLSPPPPTLSPPPPTLSPPPPTLSPPPPTLSPPPPVPSPPPPTPLPPPPSSLPNQELLALQYFKGHLTADPTGAFYDWNNITKPNYCNWNAVTCSQDQGPKQGRVISIVLPDKKLEGKLTPYIVDLPFLETLDLGGNKISGPIPDQIGTLNYLKVLRLNGNSLSGLFPANLSSCTALEELNVEGCGFSDFFPDMLQNFTALEILNMGDNYFTGTVPKWLGWSPILHFLHLGGNRLTGLLPSSVLNCSSLEYLNVSSNNLTGSVDSTVGNLVGLQTYLDLSHNYFTGVLPSSLGALSELQGLDLSGNHFSGRIPDSLGNCSKLQSLDLSSNQFNGSIPEVLSLLQNLTLFLNLSHNALEGAIPEALASLQNLAKLDLSDNNLSGQIPEKIANMTHLVFFNVSNNNLEGFVPDTGSFHNLSSTSFLGNPGLCGTPVGRLCPWQEGSPKSKKPFSLFSVVGVAIEGSILLIFVLLLCQFLYLRRNPKQTEVVVLFSKYLKALKLTAEEIQAATACTDTSGMIAGPMSGSLSGTIRRAMGFSNIEKAVLPDGTVFAVKQWNIARFGRKARRNIDAEMMNYGSIRHRNLVRIMGFYMNPHTLATLMEFVPNGTLELHLHPPGQHSCQLKWEERLRIIMGITEGLVYLHHGTCGNGKAIVHCDVKAANVLLDCEMEPKLVDIGMSRLIKRSHKGSTAASWIGPSGYTPPEYGFSDEVSLSGDVYSYGVLLLELITGKKPASEEVGVGPTLPTWIRSLRAQNREQNAIDMAMFQCADEARINQILHVMRAAIPCTSHVPAERPNMLEVLENLREMPEVDAEEELLVPVVAPEDPVPPEEQ